MNPEQLKTEIAKTRFRKSLFGYSRKEVEKLLDKVVNLYQTLYAEKEDLSSKLAAYAKQEELLSRALLRAEEAAEAIKKEAERDAEALQAQARNDVVLLQKQAEVKLQELDKEVESYKEKFYQRCYSYERELRLLLDRFYSLVRHHLDALDREVISEVQSLVRRIDEDVHSIPRPSMPVLMDDVAATSTESRENSEITKDDWHEKEETLLVGSVLHSDIYDEQGHLVVQKDTVVTPELIRSLIAKGLYGELVVAILGNDKLLNKS